MRSRSAPYAPYSQLPVGAAALVDDGRIVTGCNVENASYGLTLCAECGLVSALHASGGGRLVAFVVRRRRDRRAADARAVAAASCCGRRAAPHCRSTPMPARSPCRRCSRCVRARRPAVTTCGRTEPRLPKAATPSGA